MIVYINAQNDKLTNTITVSNLNTILGNPFLVAALVIGKSHITIDKDWTIVSAKLNKDGVLESYYDDDTPCITFGEMLESATSDDYADLAVMPKVKITEDIISKKETEEDEP